MQAKASLEEQIKNLKVSNIANFSQKVNEDITTALTALTTLYNQYLESDDLNELDNIKREYAGFLIYLATLYGEVKKFKGANHTFMEEERKLLKAKVLKRLKAEKTSFAEANAIAYDDIEYKAVYDLITKLKSRLIAIEELYQMHQKGLDSIIQTISIKSKRFNEG